MKNIVKFFTIVTLLALVQACGSSKKIDYAAIKVADSDASLPAKKLYHLVKEIQNKGIAFGHQDATAYGIGWKHSAEYPKLKSDIEEITGKYPAVQGFDLGHIELGNTYNLDTVAFSLMKDHIQKMSRKGAIFTFSWHLDNPVTNGGSWDNTSAVSSILEGGEQREKFEQWVKRLSAFFNSLEDENGDPIAVVFRPWHEMNGSWFWWGKGNCTPQEYQQLWKETITLLQENGVHNLLYAYSPNIVSGMEEYNTYYPGDEYVDILGVDIYNHGGNEAFLKNLKSNLAVVKEKAAQADKPYALTETGNNNFGEDENWWTEYLYPGIKDSGIAWVLLWRNARPSHYFATYKGEISEEDFREFEGYDEILFLDEVEKISE
ncbi:glycosyl hydrolase [Zunongwangia sp. F363]|uniref:Mannan endo-1,4-beta-mannosidase n=1 Tax=Autumnicola tepida TaxID=3075595 RepID=A0ABU3CBN3_9FLAO|nr:glycosyl hydrolase [Zunongwangia sp. F363]MDT0643745.1 glycosyl hydrolase [Zunongwangia sp. F363]